MKNNLKSIICLIVCFFLSSCNTEEQPENILSHEQMSTILLDIYEAETNLAELKINRDTTIQIFKEYEKLIYSRYNVDEETYKESLTYYYDNPDKLEKIYETMLDTLALRESRAKALEEKQKQKQDSLRQVKLTKGTN